jgi:hypothetical protein
MLGGIFYRIRTLVMPPPKKLEWWETDVFEGVVVLVMLLAVLVLVVLGLWRCLRRGR